MCTGGIQRASLDCSSRTSTCTTGIRSASHKTSHVTGDKMCNGRNMPPTRLIAAAGRSGRCTPRTTGRDDEATGGSGWSHPFLTPRKESASHSRGRYCRGITRCNSGRLHGLCNRGQPLALNASYLRESLRERTRDKIRMSLPTWFMCSLVNIPQKRRDREKCMMEKRGH